MQIHIYLLKRDNNVTFLIKIVFSYKKISNKKLFIILLLLPWQMLNLALYINHFHEKKLNCIYIPVIHCIQYVYVFAYVGVSTGQCTLLKKIWQKCTNYIYLSVTWEFKKSSIFELHKIISFFSILRPSCSLASTLFSLI